MRKFNIDIAISLSDLYESTHSEGGEVSALIDAEILPFIGESSGYGLGERFGKIIDHVRRKINQTGREDIRSLKGMLKVALQTWVKKTSDVVTAREVNHYAIMSGFDTMLTTTASVILANAFAKQSPSVAREIVHTIAAKLMGHEPIGENSSGAAVGAGAIAVIVGNKKKRRKDSIFAETLEWRDIQDKPDLMSLMHEIANEDKDILVDGVMVDPTTAELITVAHQSLSPDQQKRFRSKSLQEMINYANRLVEHGLINVMMEES